MELFSEIYGCYFNVIAKILNETLKGSKSEKEISEIITSSAFSESAFYILPKLISGEWNFLKKENAAYVPLLKSSVKLPVTYLEKAWLKSLLSDKRIRLFLPDEQIIYLRKYLFDTPALFDTEDFHYFDVYSDGDNYDDANYISIFRQVLSAYKAKRAITITFKSGHGHRVTGHYIPCGIEYSNKDDKFRVYAVRIRYGKIVTTAIINMARITRLEASKESFDGKITMDKYFESNRCTAPVVIEISKERNALERSMLHFASFEKQTEYNKEHDKYISYIYYDKKDETELLIRILSFGPVIKVLGPEHFLAQVKERVARQYELLFDGSCKFL